MAFKTAAFELASATSRASLKADTKACRAG